jgi:hypothetical protein
MLTPEEGYRRAEFQRPGMRIVMGATRAREEPVAARPLLYGRAWGDARGESAVQETATSWFEYDCARLAGRRKLSLWVQVFCAGVAQVSGRMATREEVALLADSKTSLGAALELVEQARA